MNILVGSAGVPESDAAVAFAADEVRRAGGTLHVAVHVPTPQTEKAAETHGEDMKSERRRLETEVEELRRSDLDCTPHFLQGPGRTSRQLLDLARSLAIDRIVIGTRRRSAVGKLLLGSTASDVILHADCPVTCVKAEEDR